MATKEELEKEWANTITEINAHTKAWVTNIVSTHNAMLTDTSYQN